MSFSNNRIGPYTNHGQKNRPALLTAKVPTIGRNILSVVENLLFSLQICKDQTPMHPKDENANFFSDKSSDRKSNTFPYNTIQRLFYEFVVRG